LSTYFGWKMKIPWGWININKNIDSNFVWLGKEMPFQWIGVSWSEGNLISQMNTLEVGEYLWSWPKIFYKNIQFNEHKFKLNETFLSTPFDDLSWSKLNSPNMGKF